MENINSIIVIDTETGGLSALKNPMTQVALQSFQLSNYQAISQFDSYILPYNNLILEPKALEVTGITHQLLNSKGIDIKDAVSALCDEFVKANTTKKHTKKPILVGHNILFDISFITYAFNLCRVDISKYLSCQEDAFGNKTPAHFDTMWLARAKWANDPTMEKYNLTACCQRAGIEIHDAHSAQNDVSATKELFLFLINHLRTGTSTSIESENSSYRKTFKFEY